MIRVTLSNSWVIKTVLTIPKSLSVPGVSPIDPGPDYYSGSWPYCATKGSKGSLLQGIWVAAKIPQFGRWGLIRFMFIKKRLGVLTVYTR